MKRNLKTARNKTNKRIKEEPEEHFEEGVEQVDTEERHIVLDIGCHLVDSFADLDFKLIR